MALRATATTTKHGSNIGKNSNNSRSKNNGANVSSTKGAANTSTTYFYFCLCCCRSLDPVILDSAVNLKPQYQGHGPSAASSKLEAYQVA